MPRSGGIEGRARSRGVQILSLGTVLSLVTLTLVWELAQDCLMEDKQFHKESPVITIVPAEAM